MFELTLEQRDIRKAAREFAEKEFTDIARELDAGERFEDKLWKKAAELGFSAVFIDEAYGGAGLGLFEQCLIIEEFARSGYRGLPKVWWSSYFGTQLIKLFGTEEQKTEISPSCMYRGCGGPGWHPLNQTRGAMLRQLPQLRLKMVMSM